MCPSTKSTLEWSVSGEFLGNDREEEREDLQGNEDEKRQTNRHSDKEFQVKGRASQVESPKWRGAGKGKEEMRGGQAQAGGRDARRRDRQTDRLAIQGPNRTSHAWRRDRDAGAPTKTRRRERQMAASSCKT